jgi:hypothetical protein
LVVESEEVEQEIGKIITERKMKEIERSVQTLSVHLEQGNYATEFA